MRTKVLVAAAAVAAAAWLPVAAGAPPAGAGPGPTVQVSDTGLHDFQKITLTGSGFEPLTLMEFFECRGGAVDESDCDANNADFVDSDANGDVSQTVYVDARIYLPDGTEVDCRTDPAGCELGIGYLVDADQWPEAHLDFDPNAPLVPPVSGSVSPSTDLHDDDTVTITGQHLSYQEEAWAFLCAPGTGMVGTRCDLDRAIQQPPEQDMTISFDLEVRSTFPTPLNGTVDCSAPDAGCFIQLSWGFTMEPDRVTQIPVSFAAEETTTTTTTTTPSSTTTTTPPTPPPPAPPVPGTSSFTG
jgi:hypothetical protein